MQSRIGIYCHHTLTWWPVHLGVHYLRYANCDRKPRLSNCTEIVTTRDLALLPELLNLENRCFKTYYTAHRFDYSRFNYYLRNDQTINVVAKHSDKVIGYTLGIAQRRSRRHISRIHSIAVDPSFQRQSIGTQLLERFVLSAKAMGCRVVIAEIAARCLPAIALFEHLGFKQYCHLPDYYGSGIDGVRVRLDLKSC